MPAAVAAWSTVCFFLRITCSPIAELAQTFKRLIQVCASHILASAEEEARGRNSSQAVAPAPNGLHVQYQLHVGADLQPHFARVLLREWDVGCDSWRTLVSRAGLPDGGSPYVITVHFGSYSLALPAEPPSNTLGASTSVVLSLELCSFLFHAAAAIETP
jgi:hypothetical protein